MHLQEAEVQRVPASRGTGEDRSRVPEPLADECQAQGFGTHPLKGETRRTGGPKGSSGAARPAPLGGSETARHPPKGVTTMTQVAQKTASVIARVEFKKNGIVSYRVASSSGHSYNVV